MYNYFIPYSAQLGESTHPSQHRHFHHMQLLLLCFLHCPGIGTVQRCWSYYKTLSPQVYSSVTQNPRYTLSCFAIVCVIPASMSLFSVIADYCNVFTLCKCSICRFISKFLSQFPYQSNLRQPVLFILIFSPCLQQIAHLHAASFLVQSHHQITQTSTYIGLIMAKR